MNNIRNFCIIAHIDHGKSTLADRFLELTKTVDKRKMKEQVLDQMELERERGITIKLQPVRMDYDGYILNLIDTPGHVDFSYEVSRSLAAVEGAILLVDATQGIQAQTLANYNLAVDQGLKIIPVLNKIDLPGSRVEETEKEVRELLVDDEIEILKVSAKTGQGADEVLKSVVKNVPSPTGPSSSTSSNSGRAPVLQALVFDSVYDDYRGVVSYVRVVNGRVKKGDKIFLVGTKKQSEVLEVGYFKPNLVKSDSLEAGEIGYIVTGFKDLSSCRVGDTVIHVEDKTQSAKLKLPGYKEMKPMVFAGIFCKEGVDFKDLREGLEKIGLTDASLSFEPENSPALGPGFRCGFLGLLHLEIIQERLHREFDLDLMVTIPSVAYKVFYPPSHKTGKMLRRINSSVYEVDKNNNKELVRHSDKGLLESEGGSSSIIHSPQELPNQNMIEKIDEPWVKIDVITPQTYLGNIMELINEKRGIYLNTEYLSETRVVLHYELPLFSLLTDFYDKIKSVSSGYASLNYKLIGYRECNVERLDILVAEDLVDSLAMITYKDESYRVGRKIVDALKETLPKQMFEIKIQAVLGFQDTGKNKGGKIIASSRIAPYRKDVTAKLYGGDVTRKNKLLEKQKKGKKKMKAMGRGKVDIPSEAYVAVLKR
ncbi:MAG: translation elongation factor 4 [Patescibacteria group bacterium]